jgi:hypothetical protein
VYRATCGGAAALRGTCGAAAALRAIGSWFPRSENPDLGHPAFEDGKESEKQPQVLRLRCASLRITVFLISEYSNFDCNL